MRKTLLALVVSFGILGCGIPAEIKTEIDFLDVVLSTAVKEVDAAANAEQKTEKAVNAIRRAAPHAENLKHWVEEKDHD